MFQKFLNFIKYNNFAVLVLLAFFVFGGGVFAQTEAGKEIIGREKTEIAGIDNTVLLEADLGALDMNYRIENIEEDDAYYYVTYTFLDLIERESAWQYIVQEKIRKVSKKSRVDLPDFLAKEFKQMYEAKIKYLKEEKTKAETIGTEKRFETKKYGGLIGKSLDVVGSVFVDFETVKVRELPSPSIPPTVLPKKKNISKEGDDENQAPADSITDVYKDYIDRKDPDRDNVFGVLDNCPDVYNPNQIDSDDNGVGDVCEDIAEDINDIEDNIDNESPYAEATEDKNIEDEGESLDDDGNAAGSFTDVQDDKKEEDNESPYAEATEDKDIDGETGEMREIDDENKGDDDNSEESPDAEVPNGDPLESEDKDIEEIEKLEIGETGEIEDIDNNNDDGSDSDEEPDVIIVELE